MSVDTPAPSYWDAEARLVLLPKIPRRPEIEQRDPWLDLRQPSRLDSLLTRIASAQALWLTPVLILQAVLTFRLTNSLEEDEALYINSGHQIIANMLHGTKIPDFGSYFSGVPALYTVPAAILDRLGGTTLVHTANTLMIMLATVFIYLTTRRLFGHGAALIAAAIFAINPATIFVARFASFDAPSLLLLTAAFYFAVRATDRGTFAVLAGMLPVGAAAEKYFALAFVPSVLAILVAANLNRTGRRPTAIALARTVTAMVVAAAITGYAMAPGDWAGLRSTSVYRLALLPESRLDLLGDSWTYIGPLIVAGLFAAIVLRRTWLLALVLLGTALIPAAAQIYFGESASLHKNIAFGVVFLAPLVGVAGMALLRRGRHLAVRAPLALVGVVLLLSSGIGTSAAMVRGWPNSTRIDNVLRQYAHQGDQRYLVDGSSIPAYYLSDVTNYNQWISTYDIPYATAGGAQRLRNQIANGDFRLVLYRTQDATPALDRAMISTLRERYTLVARVPIGTGTTHEYWSLWLSELPR
jgi:hypothetical protein